MTAISSEIAPPDASPLGGLDPNHFDWTEAWHPVFYVEDLDTAKPNRFTLLAQDPIPPRNLASSWALPWSQLCGKTNIYNPIFTTK